MKYGAMIAIDAQQSYFPFEQENLDGKLEIAGFDTEEECRQKLDDEMKQKGIKTYFYGIFPLKTE